MSINVSTEVKQQLLQGVAVPGATISKDTLFLPYDTLQIGKNPIGGGLVVSFISRGKTLMYMEAASVDFDKGETLTLSGVDGLVDMRLDSM